MPVRFAIAGVLLLAVAAGCDDGGPSASARAGALETALRSDDGGDLDDDAARCTAAAVVELLDAEALGELDGPADALLDADLDELGLDVEDADDADELAEVFDDCDVDLDDVDADDLRGLAGQVTEAGLAGAYVAALGDVVEGDPLLADDLDRSARRCIGAALVAATGIEELTRAVALDEVDDADAVADLELDVADSAFDDLAGELAACDVDVDAVGAEVVEDGLFLPPEATGCFVAALEEDTVRELAARGVVLGAEDAGFDLGIDFEDALFEAFEACEEDLGDVGGIPSAEDPEYVASFEAALVEDPAPTDPAEAACLAGRWVRDLGPGFFPEVLLVEPFDLAVLDDLPDLGFLEEDVELLVEAAPACQADLSGLALAVLDTAPPTPEQRTCFVAVLADPDVAGDVVVGHLTGELEDDEEAQAALDAALLGCGLAG